MQKKSFWVLVLGFVGFWFCGNSWAQTEKPQTSSDWIGYDNGIWVKTLDNRFSAKIGGYFQGEFDSYLAEDRDGKSDTDTFRVPRARISIKGHVYSEKVRYNILYDFSPSSLNIAQLDFEVAKPLVFHVGQYAVPFSFEGPSSSAALSFVDRSLAHLTFGVPSFWEPGFGFGGVLAKNKVEYDVGVFNGDGRNVLNANNELRYSGRLVYNLSGRFGDAMVSDVEESSTPHIAVATGAMFNDLVNSTAGIEQKEISLTGEVNVKHKGLGTHNAFFFRRTKPDGVSPFKDYGFLVSVGYMVVPKTIEVAARVTQIFPENLNDKAEYTLGLSYFIFGGHKVKIQTDYSLLTEKNGVRAGNDAVDHQIRALAQIAM